MQSSSHLQQLKVSASHLTGNCHTINTSIMFANRATTTYVLCGTYVSLFQMMWEGRLPAALRRRGLTIVIPIVLRYVGYKFCQTAESSEHCSYRSQTAKINFDHALSSLTQLHWLPIKCRVTFKLATLTHKILHCQ